MRRRIFPLATLFALLLLCLAIPVASTLASHQARAARAVANAQSLRILFIGNSLTDFNSQTDGTNGRNNLPLVFQQLAQSGNHTVEVHDNIMLGQSLQDQWNAGTADNLIKNDGPWNYVVLQDSSTLPADDPQAFYSDVRLFIPDIRSAGAQPLLFENWPIVGAPANTINTLTNSYQTISQEQHVPVIPFGQAWSNALQKYSTSDLFADDRHPVYAGTYLNASTFYGFLFQQSPVGLSSLDLNQFTSINANDLQTIAWNTVENSPFGTPTQTPTPTPTPTQTPTSGGTVVTAINAGGNASGSFGTDTDYDQGNQYSDTSSSIDTTGVSNPAPQAVYQTCRWNSAFTYTIPNLTAGAGYTVRLHWAELTFSSPGQRVFNVAINGSTVLSNFDVYANAGYKKALVKEFTATADSNGQIGIAFTQGGADNPFISGIEILSASSGTTPTPTNTPAPVPTADTPVATATDTPTPTSGSTLVTAINAGGGASGNFSADTVFEQGNAYSDTSSSIDTTGVSNPAPQAVYQTCRWGSSLLYTIPHLTAGSSYTVRLHWAELTFSNPGQRVFNVAINGNTVLSNFDVFATGGYKKALVKEFTATADSNGQINISFTQAGADNPFISGIEIYTA